GSAMSQLRNLVARAGPSDSVVLVLGETGTGKERVARALHLASGRKGRFVAVNCAAIPSQLLESELFGAEKGAFTGATARRLGRFEQAEGGTLLLDEIGELPLELQAKLLRVLEQREVERLGGTAPVRVDVRVVAATHRDLRNFVERLHLLRDPGPLVVDEDAARLLAPAIGAAKGVDGLGTLSYRELCEEAERGILKEALARCGGNVAAAARLLKVDRGN